MSVITGEQIMLVGSDDGDDGRPNMELPMSLDDKQNLTAKKKTKSCCLDAFQDDVFPIFSTNCFIITILEI